MWKRKVQKTDDFEKGKQSLASGVKAWVLGIVTVNDVSVIYVAEHKSADDNELRMIPREKGRDLTQSCDKKPYTHRTI